MPNGKERPEAESAAANQSSPKPQSKPQTPKEPDIVIDDPVLGEDEGLDDDEEFDEDQDEEQEPGANLDDVADLADEPIAVMEYTIQTTDPADMIESDPKDLRRTNALPPSAWIQSPAMVSVPIEGIKVLLRVARKRKWSGNKIPHVRLLFLKTEKLLLVAPTLETSSKAVDTARIRKGPITFNAISVLQTANMTVTKGYKELFRVGMTDESPIGPAMVIDMNRVVKSKIMKKRSKKKKPDADTK